MIAPAKRIYILMIKVNKVHVKLVVKQVSLTVAESLYNSMLPFNSQLKFKLVYIFYFAKIKPIHVGIRSNL